MVSTVSAVNAYNKALAANKKIKASLNEVQQHLKPRAVLRSGDDFTILQKNTVEAASAPHAGKTFGKVLQEALIQSPINSLEKAGKSMLELAQADGQELGPDILELMEAVNSAQLTLNTILTVRESFVEAYKTILNMPI
jgi:flagellar hook-basal body complex protein FliE